MKQILSRFFLFLAAFTLALGQPTVPVSNISPVNSMSLLGRYDPGTGRGQIISIGEGLTLSSGGVLSASGSGGGAAPSNATFITQTPDAQLTNEQALSALSTGILKSTTGTGVVSIATPNSDFMAWVPVGTSGNVLTSNGTNWVSSAPSTSGNVTAAGTLDSGNIVIGQGGKAIATTSAVSVSGSNVTVTGNLAITGSTLFNNLTTANLTVTGNIVGNLAATQVTVEDAGGYYTGTNAETVLQEVGASITALQQSVGPPASGSQLISGGGVALAPGGGFDITVSAATYSILGDLYASPMTDLTLAASDPTNPRIDVVAVNTSGAAVIITGTPAATPAKPDVDPSTQLELTFFLVQAASTDLDVDVVDVYLNNAEWTTTQSGGTINVASTNNPYSGSVCIEGTSVTTNNYVQFVKPAAGTFDMADSDNLVFYIRSKAAWANNRLMTISVRDGSGQLGSAVTFDQGLFGFNSSQTTTYQQIIIPTALFAANGQAATTIRMTVGGSGGTIGWYIDDVTLQGGVASITDSSRMKWRGNYVASNFYNVNDVVLSSGIQYVSIQAGVGNTPVSSTTFWQASSAAGSSGNVTGSSLTANAIVVGDGSSAIKIGPAPGTSGNIITSNGTAWNSVAMGGNATINSSGSITIANSGVSAGSYTTANITVGADGRVTAASNGTGSGGGGSLTKIQWNALDNQPPSANYATYDTRNSIGLLNFDAGTDESAVFVGILAEGTVLTTGLSVTIKWTAATATSGDCVWLVAWERCNTDIDSDSFATGVSVTTTTSGTSGIPNTTTINFNGTTEIDGLTVGDMFRLKVTRDADAGGDTMTGDAQLLTLEVQQR